MTIECQTSTEFFDTIKGMVERGLTFKACASTLSITLTGGY